MKKKTKKEKKNALGRSREGNYCGFNRKSWLGSVWPAWEELGSLGMGMGGTQRLVTWGERGSADLRLCPVTVMGGVVEFLKKA